MHQELGAVPRSGTPTGLHFRGKTHGPHHNEGTIYSPLSWHAQSATNIGKVREWYATVTMQP